MLVLSRKLNESIRISDEIEVTVLEVCGKRVRLGITAPRHVGIRRVDSHEQVPARLTSADRNRELVMAGQ